jgi:hypothetical protein
VPLSDTGTIVRNDLIARQYTTFLYPVSGAASSVMSYTAGSITGNNAVKCGVISAPSKPKSCTATINTPVIIGYGKSYALRVMSIYGSADVTVLANNAFGQVNLVDQQILIDSTAKAQDVLRRVQVRTSVTGTAPDFGVIAGGDGSGGVCKRYAISAGSVIDPTGSYPACAIP